MEERYPIWLGGQTVGEACVRREGLYYCFSCRCKLSGTMICRLTATCGAGVESLGIPVPEGDWFCLNTRIPVKRLGEGALTVRAVPKHGRLEGKFVPLSPEEPFAYLSRLKNAFLEVRGGQVGVTIRDRETD